MKNNTGNTTIIVLIIIAILFLPAIFAKNIPSSELPSTSNEEGDDSIKEEVKAEPEPIQEEEPEQTTENYNDNINSNKESEAPLIVDPNKSIYADKIKIDYVQGSSDIPNNESIIIKNTSDKSIDITGFSVETFAYNKYVVPKAHNLPGFSAFALDDIILNPDGELYINVGTQERKINFRENICTGYFDEKSDFGNTLYHQCPLIDASKLLKFTDICISELNNIQRCTMYAPTLILDPECNQFAVEHYSYAGCVNDYKKTSDFYSDRWVAWMQRTSDFFRNEHELVKLKDAGGKLIDEYQY